MSIPNDRRGPSSSGHGANTGVSVRTVLAVLLITVHHRRSPRPSFRQADALSNRSDHGTCPRDCGTYCAPPLDSVSACDIAFPNCPCSLAKMAKRSAGAVGLQSRERISYRRRTSLVVRHAWRAAKDLVRYCVYTGRWWLPALMIVLALAAVVVSITKAAAPTVVYVLF